jgi:hypothetical protein
VTADLYAAEEIIDKQVTTELNRGQAFEVVTGRVLVHAIGARGRLLCGRDVALASRTERPWDDDRYLPHLPRCRDCALAVHAGDPRPAGAGRQAPADGLPAVTVDIRTGHGSDAEIAGAGALRGILAENDLRRWMFTDLVMVDQDIRGGFSHPLTISPRLLLRRSACALTTFLHEQLHWIQGPGMDAATAEAALRWPDPPPPPGGAHDAGSTWMHLAVCALEYQSLGVLIGPRAAGAELRQHEGYSWIYAQILADPGWFASFLGRHGLEVPAEPPVPRRYYGPDWWRAPEP